MVYQSVRKNVKIAILICTNMRNGYFIITEVGAMKKRIIHLSKSTVSVILTLCMLVSCVTVGLIATDAAQLTGENRVGAAASEDSEVGASSGDKVGASVDKDESVGEDPHTYFNYVFLLFQTHG